MNIEIRNERGTATLDNGDMSSFVVNNIANPGLFHLHDEYQLGPPGGPYEGVMCTHKVGTTVTFNR